jgi:CubicO group peptidase (beta-lactamase class C family)
MSRTAPRRLAVVVSLAALLPPAAGAFAAPRHLDPVATFDALAEQARSDWGVPGLAVVVVQDGRVLLAKGYGVEIDLASAIVLTADAPLVRPETVAEIFRPQAISTTPSCVTR